MSIKKCFAPHCPAGVLRRDEAVPEPGPQPEENDVPLHQGGGGNV